LQKTGRQALVIGIVQAVFASVLVDTVLVVLTFTLCRQVMTIPEAITLGAIASATAPAATLMVVRQYKAEGPVTKLLLPIVALDDAVGLVMFAVSFGIAQAMQGGTLSMVSVLINPLLEIVCSLALGAAMGWILTQIEKLFFSNSNRLSMTIAFVLLAIALSSRVFSYTEDVLCEHLPAILWGESDLLPDPSKITLSDDSKKLVHTLWNRWWDLRITARNRLEYKHGGRPLNSVERRLAVVEAFFSAFGYQPYSVLSELLDSVAGTPEKFTEVILERWNPPESYWKKHTSFTSVPLEHPAQIIGESRAVELLIDLIFPAMYASASLNRDEVRKDKILRYLPLLPADSGNRITRVMTDYCFRASGDVFHSSLSQQGLIHLYRNFCGKNSFDCNICAIYHSI